MAATLCHIMPITAALYAMPLLCVHLLFSRLVLAAADLQHPVCCHAGANDRRIWQHQMCQYAANVLHLLNGLHLMFAIALKVALASLQIVGRLQEMTQILCKVWWCI